MLHVLFVVVSYLCTLGSECPLWRACHSSSSSGSSSSSMWGFGGRDRVCLTAAHAMLYQLLQERRRYEEEIEANNGVFYRATLTAVPAPESIAADKGIRRAADKVREGSLGPVHVLLWSGHPRLHSCHMNGPLSLPLLLPPLQALHDGRHSGHGR